MDRFDPREAGDFEYPDDRIAASMSFDAWNYRPDAGWNAEYALVGYHVEATDGSIGKVDEDSNALDSSYLIVDTGPWIFGKKILLPAGTVTEIDHAERTIYVDRTKQQVKSSPEFDPDMAILPEYREKMSDYYWITYAEDPYGDPYGAMYPGPDPDDDINRSRY